MSISPLNQNFNDERRRVNEHLPQNKVIHTKYSPCRMDTNQYDIAAYKSNKFCILGIFMKRQTMLLYRVFPQPLSILVLVLIAIESFQQKAKRMTSEMNKTEKMSQICQRTHSIFMQINNLLSNLPVLHSQFTCYCSYS